MNTNATEALAKVASLSQALEIFAKDISKQRINIYPITMIGGCNTVYHDEEEESTYQDDCYDDILEEIELDEAEGENLGCCSGCMDCLGLSWTDFV